MIIRKCDRCGKEINIFITVQTAINTKEGYEYINIANMMHLKRNFELCKDCTEKILEYILEKKEKVKS